MGVCKKCGKNIENEFMEIHSEGCKGLCCKQCGKYVENDLMEVHLEECVAKKPSAPSKQPTKDKEIPKETPEEAVPELDTSFFGYAMLAGAIVIVVGLLTGAHQMAAGTLLLIATLMGASKSPKEPESLRINILGVVVLVFMIIAINPGSKKDKQKAIQQETIQQETIQQKTIKKRRKNMKIKEMQDNE